MPRDAGAFLFPKMYTYTFISLRPFPVYGSRVTGENKNLEVRNYEETVQTDGDAPHAHLAGNAPTRRFRGCGMSAHVRSTGKTAPEKKARHARLRAHWEGRARDRPVSNA